MIKKLLVSVALVFAVQFMAPAEAAAQCGGPGQAPCLEWNTCAFTVLGACVGGLVPATPWAGCSSDRLNAWGLVCVPCGSPGEPTCAFGPVCDTDQRYNATGLCTACGQTGEAVCLSGPACDAGNRPVFGVCAYSGFSNEPTTNVATMPVLTQAGTGPVKGIADLHTHQFSNLGFGGVQMWGAPYHPDGINAALPWCDYTWDFAIKSSVLGIDVPVVPFLGYEAHGPKELQPATHLVSNGVAEGAHHVGGTGAFEGWPTYNTYTHQQMYHKWVERAFQGGLRLMVLHMVSNEALCKGSKRRADFTCNDMEAVDRQIQAAKELEQAIDKMDDGKANNSGWYRIAYSPGQARSLIRAGKMAVVLGIEVDSLFDCKPGDDCSRTFLRGELQRYYNLGIRHVYPIHQFDNAFGGAAVFRDELNAGNAIVTGEHFAVRDCRSQGYDYNVNPSSTVDIFGLLALGVPPPDAAYYNGFAADCNATGLTATGTALIEEMIDLKFIIDIDHMSRSMMDTVLEMARTTSASRPNKYPLVSGHSSFFEQNGAGYRNEFSITPAQIDILKEIGGMITVGNPRGDCGNTSGFKPGWDYAIGKMRKDAADAFPGVAFTTDMNGFGGSTGPRFGPCATGQTNPLPYPFTGVMGGTFNAQVTGSRKFNFNDQGLAHYGLLADFFADLPRAGMTAADMDLLLNSAETYIRMWEVIDNSDRRPPPTVTANLSGTLGLNGWYRSDVTLTWEVTAADGVTPALSGCSTRHVTTDTSGVTYTCRATNSGTGETSSASVTIRRDATPPSYTTNQLTVIGPSGWTNQSVQVRFTAADNLSGVGGNPMALVEVTTEGSNQVAEWKFADRAGNTTLAQLAGINIDRTPPSLGFRFGYLNPNATAEQIAAYQAKWHNQGVLLLAEAVDSGSGVASVTPAAQQIVVEGTNLVVTATATDRVGNSVTRTSPPVKIDLTKPTIVLADHQPPANATGWNNSDITMRWACADSLSGPAAASVTETLSTEGANLSLAGRCVDLAGNTASNMQHGLNLDKTPPALTGVLDRAPNANGWLNDDVTVSFECLDALSGVQSCAPPQPVSEEGANLSRTGTATDLAGNTASRTIDGINLDKTRPAVSIAPVGPREATSPLGAAADFTPTAVDNLTSPLAPSCSPAGGTTFPLGDTTVTCSATDAAGNTGSASLVVTVIDTTPPALTVPAPPVTEATGPLGAVINYATGSALDIVDGPLAVTCDPPPASQFGIGVTTITCAATDSRGNRAEVQRFLAVADTTPPLVTGQDVSVFAPSPNGVPVTLQVAASDIVAGSVPVTCTPAIGSVFALGTTPVSCTATDAFGNQGGGRFTVTVLQPTTTCFAVDVREITYFRNSRVITSSDEGIRRRNGIAGPFDPSLWPYAPSRDRHTTTSRGTLFRLYGFAPGQLGEVVYNTDDPAITYVVKEDPQVAGAFYADLGGPAKVSVCAGQLHDYVLAGGRGNGHQNSSELLPLGQRNVPGIMLTHNSQILRVPNRVRTDLRDAGLPAPERGLVGYIGVQLQGDGNAQFREFVDVEVSFPWDSQIDREQHFQFGFHTATNTNFETFAGCHYYDHAPGNDSVRLHDLWSPNRSLWSRDGAGQACGDREPGRNQRVRTNYDLPFNAVQLLPTVNSGTDTLRLFFGPIQPVPAKEWTEQDHKRDWREWDQEDDRHERERRDRANGRARSDKDGRKR